MPTRIDVQEYTEDPTFVFADPTGNFFANVRNAELIIYNGDAANETKLVEMVAQRPCNQGLIVNRALDVRRGYTEYYSMFSPREFNDSRGDAHMAYPEGTAGLRVAVRKLPRR